MTVYPTRQFIVINGSNCFKTKTPDIPIPEDPRNKNTKGCSSSYQPFSFLRMAENN